MNVSGLDHVKLDSFDTGPTQHGWQFWSYVWIATLPLYQLLIQLLVPLIGRTSWITKAPRKISVLDDDSSSRRARLHHGCETVLRLVQVREQKTCVSHIELLVPYARASIQLLKFGVGDVRRFGIFFCQRENLRVCVCADNASFRSDDASHRYRHVAAATTDVQAFHPSDQTDTIE